MNEWTYASTIATGKALAARKVSSVELTQAAIDRIERFEPAINAICVRNFERALTDARAADAALARGEARPLLGVPITVKESFNMAGLPTTWGFPHAKDFIAQTDALAIERVKAAGAIILGKTNVPLALADWQSFNEIYGTTNNPYDTARSPGGSSGGSGAALAAGYGPFSLGSDIGGSLRVPAHFCGVAAHKPSWGIAPVRGQTPPFVPPLPGDIDLAVIGPMARSAADLALGLDVIAGTDPMSDAKAYALSLPAARHETLKDFRVLVLDSHPLLPTGKAVVDAIGKVETALRKAGTRVERSCPALPDLVSGAKLYLRLLNATLGATFPLESYERIREAVKTLNPAADDLTSETMRGIVLSHRDWFMADAQRRGLQAQWSALFRDFDAVVCPVLPVPAFPHDQSPDPRARTIDVDGKRVPYLDMLLWAGVATLPKLPATTIPVSQTAEGLPVGVQVIGPWLEDRTPLKLATLIEREIGGFIPPKGFG